MSEISPISSGGNIPQEQLNKYKNEYQKGLTLFENSLKEYQKSDETAKKTKLQDVMKKTLKVLNETSNKAMQAEVKQFTDKLNKDYQNYLKNETPQGLEQINQDIKSLNVYFPQNPQT